MIKLNKYLYLTLVSLVLASCQVAQNKEHDTSNRSTHKTFNRIVTIGGTVTEITHALGFGKRIVATDKTSSYPQEMQDLPSLGYRNNIKVEGILKMEPDIVLAQDDCIDEVVCQQLIESGVAVKTFKNEHDASKTKDLINALGIILDVEDKANILVEMLNTDLLSVNKQALPNPRPKVLFIYARGTSTQSIAGNGTFAQSIITLAGGELAVKEIDGFKPLTTEALIKANPDYLLFFNSGLASLGGEEAILDIPGVKETNAGKHRNFLAMDGLLLSGFGPRVGKAALELRKLIDPSLTANHEIKH